MGDFNPDNYKDRFVADLVAFVAGEGFQSLFERFFLTYAIEFSYEQEHKLRYYELYQEFQGLFEEQLEMFQKQLKLSPSQFFQRCRESSEEDPKCKRYIDILLSSSEYETFVKLMKIMRPIAESRIAMMQEAQNQQSDSKQVEDTDDSGPAEDRVAAKSSAKGGDDEDDNASARAGPADSKYVEMDDLADAKTGGGGGGGAKDFDSSAK